MLDTLILSSSASFTREFERCCREYGQLHLAIAWCGNPEKGYGLPFTHLKRFKGKITATVAASLAERRFSTLLLALFAGLAMALAAVGIYGLLNYWMRVREDEIAIRMALGAPRAAIVRWAGGQALRLSLCGAAIGMLGSWAVSRWLGSLVFGVTHNVTTLAAAALSVVAVGMLAAAIPIWRATQVDAIDKLHRA